MAALSSELLFADTNTITVGYTNLQYIIYAQARALTYCTYAFKQLNLVFTTTGHPRLTGALLNQFLKNMRVHTHTHTHTHT